ncbi:MAG: damage-inducible protein DinB [Thermoanaerobaculia bacterium]|nr:damage-inducible protein DinB [Thermoanaerobaculia bacterium]
MRTRNDRTDLMHHGEWADASLWTAILSHPSAASDGQILEWMVHIHSVQQAFHTLWIGEELDIPTRESLGAASEIAAWAQQGHVGLQSFVATATEETLDRILPIPWATYFEKRFGRSMGPVTVGESMLQVALHSTHHRGQVTSKLRQLEGDPPNVDYIAWLWFERPAPLWPDPDQ